MSNPQRLRPVDLARLAGISTQQVRNYEEAGVLPPAVRTSSGYRTFTDTHRRALLTYRRLLKGYGPATATRVMRCLHAGDVPGALALVDAAHAALHQERESLRAASAALQTLARESPEPLPACGLRIGEVAALLGIRTSALRVWEAAGLLAPERERGTKYRVYHPADIRDVRLIHTLRRNHYPLDQIRPVLEGLHREGSSEALSRAIASRSDALTARTTAMLEGAGALHGYLSAAGTTTGSTADGPGPSPT